MAILHFIDIPQLYKRQTSVTIIFKSETQKRNIYNLKEKSDYKKNKPGNNLFPERAIWVADQYFNADYML